jgi:hypothetical protein
MSARIHQFHEGVEERLSRIESRGILLYSTSDTHAMILDKPQMAIQWLPGKQRDQSGTDLQHVWLVLSPQLQNDEPRIPLWRIRLNIGEVSIEVMIARISPRQTAARRGSLDPLSSWS